MCYSIIRLAVTGQVSPDSFCHIQLELELVGAAVDAVQGSGSYIVRRGYVDNDYEYFLQWKQDASDRHARRGRSEEPPTADIEDAHRRRRASMFRNPS